MRQKKSNRVLNKAYAAYLLVPIAVGIAPAALTYLVDPFEAFDGTQHSKPVQERAEKAHYPLWKFLHYKRDAEIVVLGDSRARALRTKYWHEYGAAPTYNFAFGGGTIPEIYSTFLRIKDDPKLKTLVVGIQLRSFDETHKGGLNRVPEAVSTSKDSISYLKNWFVARKSWEFFKQQNPDLVKFTEMAAPQIFPPAAAANLTMTPGTAKLRRLLSPEVCLGCDLPEGGEVSYPDVRKGPNLGLGRGYRGSTDLNRELPKKFARQVTKNARSDWKAFRFSERYFSMIREIASWADKRTDRNLIFVVPPTIPEMQNTISVYGLDELNLNFRRRLSELATVVDFDFENDTTRKLENFTDAYHFNSKLARRLVGEIMVVAGPNKQQAKKILKRRQGVICPSSINDRDSEKFLVLEGAGCRVWKGGGNV